MLSRRRTSGRSRLPAAGTQCPEVAKRSVIRRRALLEKVEVGMIGGMNREKRVLMKATMERRSKSIAICWRREDMN